MPWILSLPCFVMSMAAAVKIIYLHIQHRRLATMIYQAHISESVTSPNVPVLSTSAAEMRDEAEGSAPSSLPPAADQQHYFPSPEKTTGTEGRPGTAKTGRSMASSVLHRRALPTPNGSNIVIPPLFRDNDEETIDDESASQDRSGDAEWASWMAAIRGPSGGVDTGHTGAPDPQANVLERWRSTSTSNPGPPKLPNALRGIWRLFLFQGYVQIVHFPICSWIKWSLQGILLAKFHGLAVNHCCVGHRPSSADHRISSHRATFSLMGSRHCLW